MKLCCHKRRQSALQGTSPARDCHLRGAPPSGPAGSRPSRAPLQSGRTAVLERLEVEGRSLEGLWAVTLKQ